MPVTSMHAGIDEDTALLLNASTGVACAVGSGYIYLCEATRSPASTTCTTDVPLTLKGKERVSVHLNEIRAYILSWIGVVS